MNLSKISNWLITGLIISPVLLPKLIPVFMICLLMLWIYEGGYSSKVAFFKRNKFFLSLPLLYIVFGLGLLYTENLSYGIQKMETRLPLFLLPIILPTLIHANWKKNGDQYVKWYIGASVLGSLICIVRGLYLYFAEQNLLQTGLTIESPVGHNYLFSSHLTGFIMHPGYYAVFIVMAIFLLVNFWLEKKIKFPSFIGIGAMLVLLALVFLSYAKAALLALILMSIVFGIQFAFKSRKLYYILYSGLAVILLLSIFYFFVPNTQERIQTIFDVQKENKLDPTSIESTQARIHAWSAAKKTIMQRPLFGYGTGDGNDALFETYRELNYTGALENELNAHNQYFQTGLSLGLMGVFFLILPLILVFRYAVKSQNWLLGSWVMITILVFLFESYLNTQAGAVYFSLFFTVLPLLTSLSNKANSISALEKD